MGLMTVPLAVPSFFGLIYRDDSFLGVILAGYCCRLPALQNCKMSNLMAGSRASHNTQPHRVHNPQQYNNKPAETPRLTSNPV